MKYFLLLLAITFALNQSIKAQLTCVPCDQLGLVMNVGSQETAISIYHSGQYMTHPQSENIFMWEFTNQQGNIVHQDILVDEATITFGHNWSLTDTINVSVHFVNDSANLDAWYINQGLSPSGNSINCLFEDQIYWETGANTPWGSWTFVYNNSGLTVGIDEIETNPIYDNKIYDMLGRELKEVPIGQPYIQNGKKKIILN